ncbi:hypothetical protein ZEAMMB73_Zm00001d049757 [Zea mays]|uniref:Uncharacterized protein n=1 Tax=Zea mays TaxID=4577 RepID=A0A1D6PXR6_MAIZE|nr:hypothetical protein ZEAMMB73_Zm00001d049757 [Zea mays]
MSDEDRDRERDRDRVWLHGEKVGAGFKCKYCRETKSGGGGTRLKEHLAHRGKNVKKCPSVPPDIKAYFQLDIDKTKEKKSSRFRQQLRADEAARTHFGDDDQRAGARYDRGGGSSSQRVPERVRDYNLAQASGLRQQRIDTGVGVKLPTGREIDGKYLDENVKEFQKEIDKWKIEWNEFGATLMCDSWTSPTQKSIINFLVYCNGMMYFLKTIDATGEVQDHKFIMQKAIGGELVKRNATRFGTNYMFLESFMRRKDKFMVWFMSPEFRHSRYFLTEMGRYAFDNITNVEWWENMQYVLDEVEPLYVFLRFADQEKSPTLGEVLMQYTNTKHTYQSKFENDSARYKMIMDVVDARMNTVMTDTYVQPACALHPYVNYVMGTTSNLMTDLRKGVERMFDSNTAAMALQEYDFFKRKIGDFSSDLARRMAVDRGTSPSSWWSMFGSDTPTLQRVAKRLLSQCVSSSGCERNWSTFAFIHTKLRNKLGYLKLHELVFVNYNLRIRIQRATGTPEPSEFDPALAFMEPRPQYGYGQVPAAPAYHYQYDGLDQYHDPSNMPEYYHYDSS